MTWVSLKDASKALACSTRTVQRRIKEEGWNTKKQKGADGRYRLVIDLPEDQLEREVLGHADVTHSVTPGVPRHDTRAEGQAALITAIRELREEVAAMRQLLARLPEELARLVSRRVVSRPAAASERPVSAPAANEEPAAATAARPAAGEWDGEKLRAWRNDRGLSLRALGELISCHKSAIGRWERNERVPTPANLEALRKAGFAT